MIVRIIIDIVGVIFIVIISFCGGFVLGVYHEQMKKIYTLHKGHGRKFEGIVAEYTPADLCIYPEYKGKPYFSIKYEENGKHIVGFGTYNPEVLSRYLQEYFITPTIIETDESESGVEE